MQLKVTIKPPLSNEESIVLEIETDEKMGAGKPFD